MNTRKASSRCTLWLTAALGLTASSSCSLLYDLSTHQCDTTEDCLHQGSQFNNSICQNHVCVAVAASSGGANSNGGQTSSAGGVVTSGGASQGGSGGATGGTSTVSGTGGTFSCTSSTDAECCITNAECVTKHNQPYICKNNRCLLLTDDTYCPLLIPNNALDLLSSTTPEYSPIIVGGFANMTNLQSLYETKSVINWAMAMDEFNKSSTQGGLPGYSGGNRRPFIGLMCYSNSPNLPASMKRLTEDVGVSAILTTLSPDNLITAYNCTNTTAVSTLTNLSYTGRPVIYMNAVAANLEIARDNTQNLVWNMLGDPNVVAAPVAAVLKQIEPWVNKQRALAGDSPDPNTNPLKVTLVTSDDQSANEIGQTLTAAAPKHLESKLWFNNRYAIADTTGSFRTVTEPASYVSGPNVNVSLVLAELQNHPPHVIVVMATDEFAKQVIGTVESNWSTPVSSGGWGITQIRPYYIMSQFLNTQDLVNAVTTNGGRTPPLSMRVLGVNYAEAQDPTSKALYNSYQLRLASFYQGALTLGGTENYYDAAYYLLYSIAQSSFKYGDPAGDNISLALMSRILSTSPSNSDYVYLDNPGSDPKLGQIITNFSDPLYSIALWGTMGDPSSFDKLTGMRTCATSAWCISLKSGSTTAYEIKYDGLIYDRNNKNFTANSAGVPACLQNYCAVPDVGTGSCPLNY